jgi:hypothetical protein
VELVNFIEPNGDVNPIVWLLIVLALMAGAAIATALRETKEPPKNTRVRGVLPPPSRNCTRAYPDV